MEWIMTIEDQYTDGTTHYRVTEEEKKTIEKLLKLAPIDVADVTITFDKELNIKKF